MDPNSQIELELVPMASDENLNNIQDDVNANFKQVRTDFDATVMLTTSLLSFSRKKISKKNLGLSKTEILFC